MAKELSLKERVESAKQYKVDPNIGLNDEQVKERVENKLLNKTKKTVTKSYFRIFFDNIFTVLNMILIAMAVLMIIYKLPISNFFFLLVLAINIGISLFQDIKARKLISNLSLLSNPKAIVVRNGQEKTIPFDDIVLGDVVIIKQGNTIPTDGILLDGSVKVNESILTGEMNAIKKNAKDSVYGESVVLAGTAKYKVTKIGNLNYASTIQERAKTFSRPKSEILAALTKLIRGISVVAIVFGVAQLVTIFVTRQVFADKVPAFTSSIIAMIPNGMYLMTSIALTVGVIVLSHNKILVRELYSIEMLARVNVVCVDKTGTVTDGNMVVENFIPIGKKESYVKQCISNLLFITKDDNLTAHALRKFVPFTEFKGPFFVSLPFESEKKYSAASYEGTTVVLGAAGFFHVTNMKDVEKKLHELEGEGKRIMLVAESNKVIKDEKLPNDLKVIGIIVIVEHIKDDAKANIEWFKSNGVTVKMISGDAPKSLTSIAQQVGIDEKGDSAISLEGLTDDEVRAAATKYNVFGRVLPEQKRILVEELRNSGNTVAMVGDGVNDLLALKQADCSIAMANGSDAVKAASHLVSLDSNFSSLPKVVGEGRRVINNLQRVCSLFLVKTGFAMVFTLLFLVFGWINNAVVYPYTANNLIMWETLTIGLAPFILALEPNKNKIKKGFLKNIFMNVIPAVIVQLILALILIITGYLSNSDAIYESYRSMSVILITLMSLVTLYNICLPFNKYRGIVAIGITVVMALCFGIDYLIYAFTPDHFKFFGIDYGSITLHTLILGFVVFAILVPIYLFASSLVRKKIDQSK